MEGEEGEQVTRGRFAFTLIVIVAVLAACQPHSPPPTQRSEPPAMNAPTSCRAALTPASDGEYGIRFTLTNPTSNPITLKTYEPFLQFQLRATADGAPLAVTQPPLDIPVRALTITVPASRSIDLVTPIRLRFGAGPPSQQRFVWSIAHAAKGVQLTFTLDLPAPFDQPFTAQPPG